MGGRRQEEARWEADKAGTLHYTHLDPRHQNPRRGRTASSCRRLHRHHSRRIQTPMRPRQCRFVVATVLPWSWPLQTLPPSSSCPPSLSLEVRPRVGWVGVVTGGGGGCFGHHCVSRGGRGVDHGHHGRRLRLRSVGLDCQRKWGFASDDCSSQPVIRSLLLASREFHLMHSRTHFNCPPSGRADATKAGVAIHVGAADGGHVHSGFSRRSYHGRSVVGASLVVCFPASHGHTAGVFWSESVSSCQESSFLVVLVWYRLSSMAASRTIAR